MPWWSIVLILNVPPTEPPSFQSFQLPPQQQTHCSFLIMSGSSVLRTFVTNCGRTRKYGYELPFPNHVCNQLNPLNHLPSPSTSSLASPYLQDFTLNSRNKQTVGKTIGNQFTFLSMLLSLRLHLIQVWMEERKLKMFYNKMGDSMNIGWLKMIINKSVVFHFMQISHMEPISYKETRFPSTWILSYIFLPSGSRQHKYISLTECHSKKDEEPSVPRDSHFS